MCDDEEEMYALALGEEYMPGTSAAAVHVSEPEPPQTNQSLPQEHSSCVSIELFRELLIGSRSKINKLEGKNELLEDQLKNALTSSGVVICPMCTHHFKERLCLLRPRTMKKVKARNCVELEFNNPEELQAWLYLNQLETNNDGMPTVMEVKKPSREEISSLKTVGSLLPAIHERKKKEDEKKARTDALEKADLKKSEEKKYKYDEHHEKHKPQILKKDHPKKLESKDTDKVREKMKETSRSRSSPTTKSRESVNKDTKKDKDRSGSVTQKKESDRSNHHYRSTKSDNHKRKLSPPKGDIRDSKSQKRTITERIHFLEEKKSSPNTFDSIIKDISKSVKEPRHSDKYSVSTSESSQTMKTRRQPIVWGSSENEVKTFKTEVSAIPFEFKVKPLVGKKVLSTEPNISSVSPTAKKTGTSVKSNIVTLAPKSSDTVSASPNFTKPSASKYKFVPTFKKSNISTDLPKKDLNDIEEVSAVGETKDPVAFEDKCALSPPIKETMVWRSPAVRKTTTFYQRVREVRTMWVEKMMIERKEELPTATSLIQSTTTTQSNNSLSANGNQADINKINLKDCGISAEGLAILQLFKNNYKSTECNAEINIGIPKDEDADNGMMPTSHSQGLSTSDDIHSGTENNVEEDDEFREFFPDLLIGRPVPAATPKLESSHRPYSTASYSSMMDREEDELQLLIREDSSVPPNGDLMIDIGLDQYASGSTKVSEESKQNVVGDDKNQTSQKNDWEEFCLEDLDEEIDDTIRERKLSEMEKLGTVDEEMEWTASQEDEQICGDEECEESREEHHENSNASDEAATKIESLPTKRCISSPLEMGVDFRLSDDENVESPRTSTPSRSQIPDDLSQQREDHKNDSEQPLNLKDDSFIEELDWNYGTDYEDEDEKNEEVMDLEAANSGDGVGGTDDAENGENLNQLEDGEISEDEEPQRKVVEEEPKIPMRERIKYVDKERQVRGPSPERERYRRHRSDRERSRRSPDRRRRSGEHHRFSKERDTRPATYGSLLKRRN